jgi:hypothetical protein
MKRRPIVEMSVEIIFPTPGEHEEKFSGVVRLNASCLFNHITFSNFQADVLNHSAFCPFLKSLVVKP